MLVGPVRDDGTYDDSATWRDCGGCEEGQLGVALLHRNPKTKWSQRDPLAEWDPYEPTADVGCASGGGGPDTGPPTSAP